MRLLLVVLSSLVLMSSFAYAQTTKIGVVDLRRVVTDSKKGKSTTAAVEAQFGPKSKVLESKRIQVEAMERDFIKNAAVMNEASRKQKAEKIERQKKDLTRSLEDFQYEFRKKDYELTQKIMGEIQKILKSIGQAGGYTVIVDTSVLIFYSPTTDITDQVIQAYDAK